MNYVALFIGKYFASLRPTPPLLHRRQLLVDVSAIAKHDAGTGIQRVTRAIWIHLKSLENEQFVVLPVVASRRRRYRVADSNFLDAPLPAKWGGLSPLKVQQDDIYLGLDLAAHIIPHRQRQLKRWRARGVHLAIFVYDLLPALHPDWFSERNHRNYMRWLNFVTQHAHQAICISRDVARSLENWIKDHHSGKVDRPDIATVKLSGNISTSNPSVGFPVDAQHILAWALERPTIMMVGTIEPRKGYDQALAAFELLWAKSPTTAPRLVIVGRPGWKTEGLQQQLRNHPAKGKHFVWIENASDAYLQHLYETTKALLVASRGEGFGLPIVEATMRGHAVLARDLPVFREIAPSQVSFFSGETPESLAHAIENWFAGIGTADICPTKPAIFQDWSTTTHELIVLLGLGREPINGISSAEVF